MRFINTLRPLEILFILLFAALTSRIMIRETRRKGYISGLLGSDAMTPEEIIRTILFLAILAANMLPAVLGSYIRGQFLAIGVIGLFLTGLVIEVIANIIIINRTSDPVRDKKALLDTGKDLVLILALTAIILKQNPSALF